MTYQDVRHHYEDGPPSDSELFEQWLGEASESEREKACFSLYARSIKDNTRIRDLESDNEALRQRDEQNQYLLGLAGDHRLELEAERDTAQARLAQSQQEAVAMAKWVIKASHFAWCSSHSLKGRCNCGFREACAAAEKTEP